MGRRRGVIVEFGKIMMLNRDLVARNMVGKAPLRAKKVWKKPTRRIQHERRNILKY